MSIEFKQFAEPEPDQLLIYDGFIDRRTQSTDDNDKKTLVQGVGVSLGTSSISTGERRAKPIQPGK